MTHTQTCIRSLRWARYGLAIGACALAACNTDKLVNIQNPDLIVEGVVQDTANVEQLRNGTLFEFARALTGPAANNATPGIIGISGLLTDEMWYASTFPTMQDMDRRNITPDNSNLLLVYQYMHRARNLAERTIAQYALTSQANSTNHALVTNVDGYVYLLFAETFCSGVPFSQAALTGELTFGPSLTTAQMLDSAVTRFNEGEARARTAGSTQQQHFAQVGRARALLARGDFAGAAAVAATVPSGFVYNLEYSENSSGQNNGVWYNINSEKRSSVASLEGGNGLDYFRRGPRVILGPAGDTITKTNTTDPRTPADSAGTGIGGTRIQLYTQGKYATRGAAVPLASSTEARLIEAEAALSKGQSNAYLPTLNTLRASVGLGPLTDPGTPDARVRQFFRERAFWLWLTAHRLGDLRRLIRYYGYGQAQVFPNGQTIFGAPYGTDINFPVPLQEQNNPQFPNGQCVDRGA